MLLVRILLKQHGMHPAHSGTVKCRIPTDRVNIPHPCYLHIDLGGIGTETGVQAYWTRSEELIDGDGAEVISGVEGPLVT